MRSSAVGGEKGTASHLSNYAILERIDSISNESLWLLSNPYEDRDYSEGGTLMQGW